VLVTTLVGLTKHVKQPKRGERKKGKKKRRKEGRRGGVRKQGREKTGYVEAVRGQTASMPSLFHVLGAERKKEKGRRKEGGRKERKERKAGVDRKCGGTLDVLGGKKVSLYRRSMHITKEERGGKEKEKKKEGKKKRDRIGGCIERQQLAENYRRICTKHFHLRVHTNSL